MEQKKRSQLLIDIILVFAITGIAYAIYAYYYSDIFAYANNNDVDILFRALAISFFHFCLAGLAMCLVMLFRKEKFKDMGLDMENAMPSLAHSAILAFAFFVTTIIKGTWVINYPFRPQTLCNDIMTTQPIPIMIAGALIMLLSCGFFEAYNYAYVSRKINLVFPVKNLFLKPGPIITGILGYIAHATVGINGWIESIPLMFLIYGLMLIYEKTDNAWGAVLAFSVIWTII